MCNIKVVFLAQLVFEQQRILVCRISIQDEAMDVARSAPQGAHYYADVIYLLP